MKSTTTFLRRTPASTRLMVVVIACLMAACSNPVEPGDDDPAATGKKIYDVNLDFKRISVLGDCDTDPLGVSNDGEFHFRVGYSVQRPEGTWSSLNIVKETDNFGSLSGSVEKKTDNGGVYTISKTVRLTLEDGLNYRIHLSAIEWDVPIKDGRMDGKTATEEDNTGGSTLNYSHKLDLGDSGACKVRLYVDATQLLK